MSLASAERIAIAVTEASYINGDLEIEECERRIGILLGLEGGPARAAALATAEYVDVTSLGSAVPTLIATRWTWTT